MPSIVSEKLPTSRKVFDLEGEAAINADGRSRQDELFRSVPGEPVTLAVGREDGRPIVTALSARNVPIGRLTDQYAALLAPLLGRPHRARLHCLRGGVPDYPRCGARISIAWGDRPDHPYLPLDGQQIEYRRRRASQTRASVRDREGKSVPMASEPAPTNQGCTFSSFVFLLFMLVVAAATVYAIASIIGSGFCVVCD